MKRQIINVNSNKYSNLKGEIGVIIAKEFLKEYFRKKKDVKFFDVHNLDLSNFRSHSIKLGRGIQKNGFTHFKVYHKFKIKENYIKKVFYKESIINLERLFSKDIKKYHPDLLLSIDGKMHIIEVKCSSSVKKKKELHSYQRKALSQMAKHFPVLMVYINLSGFGISIETYY